MLFDPEFVTSLATPSSIETLPLPNVCVEDQLVLPSMVLPVADSLKGALNSPHLEIFKKKDIEVILMHDRIDEWMMNYLTEFDGKSFQSVTYIVPKSKATALDTLFSTTFDVSEIGTTFSPRY